MRSTGEVMGLDRDYEVAFAKSQLGSGTKVPVSGTAFISVKDTDKPRVLDAARRLAAMGFRLIATGGGTQRFLVEQGVAREKVNKALEGRSTSSMPSRMAASSWFSTPLEASAPRIRKSIRQAALLGKISYYTTLAGCLAATGGIAAMRAGGLEVRPLQEYHAADARD